MSGNDGERGGGSAAPDPLPAVTRKRARYHRPRLELFGALADLTRTIGRTGMNDMVMSKIRTGL